MGWMFMTPLYVGVALVCAWTVVMFITGMYNLIKYAIMAIWDDICAARDAVRVQEVEAVNEWRKPASFKNINETLAHIGSHPSMDGLGSGMGAQDVNTRFNR